jgi:hypothetical protein
VLGCYGGGVSLNIWTFGHDLVEDSLVEIGVLGYCVDVLEGVSEQVCLFLWGG